MGQNDGSEEKSWFILEATSLTLLFYCRKLHEMESRLKDMEHSYSFYLSLI